MNLNSTEVFTTNFPQPFKTEPRFFLFVEYEQK